MRECVHVHVCFSVCVRVVGVWFSPICGFWDGIQVLGLEPSQRPSTYLSTVFLIPIAKRTVGLEHPFLFLQEGDLIGNGSRGVSTA